MFSRLAVWQSKKLEGDKIISEASRLRTMAVGHMVKNASFFKDFWSPDSEETPIQRDHQPPPEDFSDYCALASRRNYWVDGLLLQSLSQRLDVPIISFVWNAGDGDWRRNLITPSSAKNESVYVPKGIKPLCFILKDSHFGAFVPDDPKHEIPKAWYQPTPILPRSELRGAGKSSSLSLPSTPKQSVISIRNAPASGSKVQNSCGSSQLSIPASRKRCG